MGKMRISCGVFCDDGIHYRRSRKKPPVTLRHIGIDAFCFIVVTLENDCIMKMHAGFTVDTVSLSPCLFVK